MLLGAERALEVAGRGATPESLTVTVPDWAKAKAAYDGNATSQLWRDPALKPFKDKLLNKISEEFLKPLERELGVKLKDYNELAQGQLTLAVLQNGWQGKDGPLPAWLLLVDTRDKSGQLKTNLGGVPAYVAKAPDFSLHYTKGKFPLTFTVSSVGDTTLLINLPNVKDLHTSFSLGEVKASSHLPLSHLGKRQG